MIFLYLLISIAIGALIAWAIVGFYKGQMTNVATPGEANEYIVKSSFKVHSKRDKFLYSDLSVVEKTTDNNNDKND